MKNNEQNKNESKEMKKPGFMYYVLTVMPAVLIALLFVIDTPTFANGTDPKIYTGTKALITKVTSWLMALIPITGGCMVAWQQLKKKMSDNDPAETAQANKRTKQIFVATAIGLSASGIVNWVATFYA